MNIKLLSILSILLFTLSCAGCALFKSYAFNVVDAVNPPVSSAVVKVIIPSDEGSCSGFHVGNNRIITAGHCIALKDLKPEKYPTDILVVDQSGMRYPVEVLFQSLSNDMAILKTSIPFKGPQLDLAYKEWHPRMGSEVVALGFPGSWDSQFSFEVMRYRGLRTLRELDGREVILLSEGIFPGFSGGPVISLETGQVIGIVSMLRPEVYFFRESLRHHHDDMSIATPAYMVRERL